MRNRATRMIAWLLTVLMLVTCLPSGMLSGGVSLADGSVIDYSESVQLPWSEVSPAPRKPAVNYVTGDTSLGMLVYSAINGTYIPQGTRPTAEIQTPGDAAQAAADARAAQTGQAGRVLSQFRLGSSDDGWQPDGPIRVTVNLNEPLGTYDNEALTLARLTDEGEAVSINTPLIARGNQLRAFSFTADALAVYAILGAYDAPTESWSVTFLGQDDAVIETRTVAAGDPIGTLPEAPAREGYSFVAWVSEEGIVDENTIVTSALTLRASYQQDYPATVADAQMEDLQVHVEVPEGALPADARFRMTAVNSEDYREAVEQALGMTTGTIKAVDMTFVGADGAEYQPLKPVTVQVTVKGMGEAEKLSVVHIADSGEAEVVYAGEPETIKMRGGEDQKVLTFAATGFSIYAIVDKESGQSIARAKIIFQNTDGTPFSFLNNAGNYVDNQIIRSGSVLEEVGMPEMDADGQTFQGWYIYDTDNNSYTSYQLKLGGSNTWTVSYGDEKSITSNTAVVTSEEADDDGCAFYARPYFGEVNYLTFYNESAGDDESLGGHGIILNRIQVIKGTQYDISAQQATPPDSIWDEGTQSWKPVSYVFAGWSDTAGSDNDNRSPITNTTITVNESQTYYPIFKQGHWVTFDSAPTGSGATYIPAKIVLSTETTSVARPTVTPTWEGHTFVGWFTTPEAHDPENANYYNANGTINPTYNGYFSTNENANGAYRFNQSLNNDLTLYAHWNAGTANVTVVKWQQVVTDDKNAATPTKEQMAADGYNSNTSLKHYEYAGQQNLEETVNSILRNNDGDITVPTGFNLNSTLSDAQVVVKDDGTAVLNLYFDRKLITMNFDRDIESYTETTGNSGTQYGLVDGEYVQLSHSGNSWTHTVYTYKETDSTNGTQYGLVNGEYVELYNWYGTWYYGNWNRYYGKRYSLSPTPVNYTGTRYTRTTTRSFTGLYGQTLTQNGYTWPNGVWKYRVGYNNYKGISYLGQFVLPDDVYNTDKTIIEIANDGTAVRTIEFYLQDANNLTVYDYNAKGDASSTRTSFVFSEKYNGFTVSEYRRYNEYNGSRTYESGGWHTATVDNTVNLSYYDGMEVRYRRLVYTVKFLDSHDGSVLPDVPSKQVV